MNHENNIDNYTSLMEQAYKLAKAVKGNTSPNPAVGALIVKNGKIIGKGATQKPGSHHAEVMAINSAKENIEGSTLIVTLEPCCTTGRTPPCTDLIISKKIKRVIIGTLDPNPKVNGKGILQLRRANIECETGLLEEQLTVLNEDYFKYIKKKIPFCTGKYAMTLDGKIASSIGDSKWISSEKSRNYVHNIRAKVDAILVGVNTVIKDDPLLTVRNVKKHKDPVRIILDGQGRTPLNSNVLTDNIPSIFILKEHNVINNSRKQKLIETCEKYKKTVIKDPSIEGTNINLDWLMLELGKMGIESILVEGGSEVFYSMIRYKILDKLICFISPKILLGRDGKFPIGGIGFDHISDAYILKKTKVKQIENDVMISGYIDYNNKNETY